MSILEGHLLGKEEVLERFRKRRDVMMPRLSRFMLMQMARLAEYVRANKLSGQVLANRTGTLRRSIHPSVEVEETAITGMVGTNVSYARIHEFGGTFTVPAHDREQTMAWGRPIPPRTVRVRQHMVTFPERAFLRPALNERRDEMILALRGEVMNILREP